MKSYCCRAAHYQYSLDLHFKLKREVRSMKVLRIVFFSFFVFTALISTNMIYNLLRIGYGMRPLLAGAFFYIIVQLAGLIAVVINRSRAIMGSFTIATGLTTGLSGSMTFASLGAPAPQGLGIISLISMGASFLLFIGYMVLAVLFFTKDNTGDGSMI
jgi:hypothetical protein